jgi:hypothetical protein
VVHVAETWPGTSTQILVYLEMLNNFFVSVSVPDPHSIGALNLEAEEKN